MEWRVLVRAAVQSDLPALTDIYNDYVLHSTATFDVETFSVEQRQLWFDQFDSSGPHRLFVAERDRKIIGYASSTQFRPKPAYCESVEVTIYLATDESGGGVGRQLYTELFAALASEQVHRAYAITALPNDASRALHIKFGFQPLCILSEVGRKFGRYIDTEWFEKKIT